MRTIYLFIGCLSLFLGCQRPQAIETDPDPSFNQVNISFEAVHVDCLLSQWYSRTYKNEPIVFRLINDQTAYQALFPCSLTTALPRIDFSKNSLLIGMKADYGQFINTPGSITQITQKLLPTTAGNYTLQVEVTGQGSENSQTGGHAWFAFVSLVPRVAGTVTLDMRYHFK